MNNKFLSVLFNFDALAVIMVTLVTFIGLCVGSFAYRYLMGNTKYRSFFIQLTLLILSVSVMVSADNIIMLFMSWCLSNVLLVKLMIHKKSWKAAKASGMLALKNYIAGAVFIAVAFVLLYWVTSETSLQALVKFNYSAESTLILSALSLLLIGAMTQSAIWPFHRWLISSLNSPTPVSAIMHAGLINGGGILLTRFAPLYLQHSHLLTTIFLIGIGTSLVGSMWKLMQSDVKRMLACSTIAQMGFMFAQCGLGLFPAAVAHIVWHGMFKAYLFLSSGGAAQEKRLDLRYPPKSLAFICAIICGVMGSFGFAFASGKSWLSGDTTLVLMIVSFLSASQFSLTMLTNKTLKNLVPVFILTGLFGLVYGASVQLITTIMDPMKLIQTQPLNGFHFAGMIALILTWLAMLFSPNHKKTNRPPTWVLKGYVAALNASQPASSTITAHRNQYAYI
ncbi:MAG: proton-conducting transporter membrane subunit [Candidatus Paracaedibacteraceae bacterium]|nr:proton-conducting transporter membrane subunit [Candidatus Paracaedibacteraceae bacterium]